MLKLHGFLIAAIALAIFGKTSAGDAINIFENFAKAVSALGFLTALMTFFAIFGAQRHIDDTRKIVRTRINGRLKEKDRDKGVDELQKTIYAMIVAKESRANLLEIDTCIAGAQDESTKQHLTMSVLT